MSGTITFSAPVYKRSDPNCCPSYDDSRTWVWDGNYLRNDVSFALTNRKGSDTQVPSWLSKDGPQLFWMLSSAKGGGFSSYFSPSTPIRGLDGQICSAPGGVVASAIGSYTDLAVESLWETSGTYRAVVYIAPYDSKTVQRPSSPVAKAGTCSLGGPGIQGYILHVSPKGDTIEVDAIEALASNINDPAPKDAVSPISL